jgi:hypothetical protein
VTVHPSRSFDDARWQARLAEDKQRLLDEIPQSLRVLHDTVTTRTLESGAEALLLTGSTARGTRTAISDCDYHLVGPSIKTDDLSDELDLHVVTAKLLDTRLREGDDFTHWSLRFGCVVFDKGIVRESVRLIAEQRLWPDSARKEKQARKSLKIARAMVASGDRDAAVEQVRTSLTLAARWRLLEDRVFPLSRAELPGQLREVGYMKLAKGLAATISGMPSLEELAAYVEAAGRLLHAPSTEVGSPTRSYAA